MSDLPDRFTSRIEAKNEQDRAKKLAYLQTIADHECPFLSTSQIARARGVSNGTARDHLRQLRDAKAVSSREIPGGGTPTEVWWLNHEESDWPIPGDLERVPGDKQPDETAGDITLIDLLMLRDPPKVLRLAAFSVGYGALLVALAWVIRPVDPTGTNISGAMVGFATLLFSAGFLFGGGALVRLVSRRVLEKTI